MNSVVPGAPLARPRVTDRMPNNRVSSIGESHASFKAHNHASTDQAKEEAGLLPSLLGKRPRWGMGATTPLLAVALAGCYHEIKPEVSGTSEAAPAEDDSDSGMIFLMGWLLLLAGLGQSTSSSASPQTPAPTIPNPMIAELKPPVFTAQRYDFDLDENISGNEEAALIGQVSATSPDGYAIQYSLQDNGGNQYEIDASTGSIS